MVYQGTKDTFAVRDYQREHLYTQSKRIDVYYY